MKYEKPEVQIIELGEMITTDVTYTSSDPTKSISSLFGTNSEVETFSMN